MLKRRIIPCLDIKDGRTVKGVNFVGLRDAGDPIALAQKYAQEGADELVFLDITATEEKRKTLKELVAKIAREINIPFTVGGGVNSLEDAKALLEAGADKIALNSAAVRQPNLISSIAQNFGRQCVVVAIDTQRVDNTWEVFIQGGKLATRKNTVQWAQEVEVLGAGEILLTSMHGDGAQQGFSLDITQAVSEVVSLPVIASGGAGKVEDFAAVFSHTQATGALAATIFHDNLLSIPVLKADLVRKGYPIRD